MTLTNHGTTYAYIEHQCRCDVCKEGNRLRQAKLRKAKAYGRFVSKFVEAAPVREHCQTLLNQGWGIRTLSDVSGVNLNQVRHLMVGRAPSERNARYARPEQITRMLKTNADKLLALRFDALAAKDGHRILALGTARRVQALVAVGYSVNWVGEQIGWSRANMNGILTRKFIEVKTAVAIRNLFDLYAYTPRNPTTKEERYSVTRSLNTARRNGWVTAMAWDDIDNDIQPPLTESVPVIDTVIVETLISGRTVPVPRGTKKLYAKAMLQYGVTPTFVCRVLNMSNTEIKLAQKI